jgi:outer membrane protein assembly factor BamA
MNSHSEASHTTDYPPITDNFSGTPGLSPSGWIPGFASNTEIVSYGGFLEYDTRDKSKDLTRGVDIYLRGASNNNLKHHSPFSDYGWLESEFDAKAHIPIRGTRTSLALRSKGQLKQTKGGSQIPFYDLSYLGGHDYVRGYDLYRFRGNNVLIVSAELRRTVYKKTDHRGIDVFALADSGQVWGDSRSTTDPAVLANQDFRSSNWHSAVGGGVDYRHSRSVAARFEVARSNEGVQVYLSMSRGF